MTLARLVGSHVTGKEKKEKDPTRAQCHEESCLARQFIDDEAHVMKGAGLIR